MFSINKVYYIAKLGLGVVLVHTLIELYDMYD